MITSSADKLIRLSNYLKNGWILFSTHHRKMIEKDFFL